MKTETARGKRAPTVSNGSTEFTFSSVGLYADKDEYLAKNLIFTMKGRMNNFRRQGQTTSLPLMG
jgi:hypothetical protein